MDFFYKAVVAQDFCTSVGLYMEPHNLYCPTLILIGARSRRIGTGVAGSENDIDSHAHAP